ncbi:hypothetical protein INR49_013868 [Caranx melampygus]|nr:hypothetical protein INR49_013868 [Caranx melampygus]
MSHSSSSPVSEILIPNCFAAPASHYPHFTFSICPRCLVCSAAPLAVSEQTSPPAVTPGRCLAVESSLCCSS